MQGENIYNKSGMQRTSECSTVYEAKAYFHTVARLSHDSFDEHISWTITQMLTS